jgi:hypothetical protein
MKKNILFLIVFCVCSLQIFADSTATIYCLVQNPTSKQLHLGMIEPDNGGVYIISNSSFPMATLNNNTIDPFKKIYYFTVGETLVGMDITNGEIRSQVKINLSQGQYFIDFEFNTRDSNIYGMVYLGSYMGFKLSKIAVETGQIEFISNTTSFSTTTNKSHTLDSDKGIYYTRSENSLFGIDIKTGLTVSNAVLNGDAQDFNFIKYNKKNGKIYGLSRPEGPGKPFYLATINPATGYINLLSPYNVSDAVTVSTQTMDIASNRYFLLTPTYILGIEMDRGEIRSSTFSNKVNMYGFNSLNYKYTGEKTKILGQGNEGGGNGGGGGNLSNSTVQSEKISYSVYPNPANDHIKIESNQLEDSKVQLFNSIGARIADIDFKDTNKLDVDVSAYPEGIYYLIINQKGHVVLKEKLMITR